MKDQTFSEAAPTFRAPSFGKAQQGPETRSRLNERFGGFPKLGVFLKRDIRDIGYIGLSRDIAGFGFPKIGGTVLGVPIIRIVISCGI